jgi:hypothetical protein
VSYYPDFEEYEKMSLKFSHKGKIKYVEIEIYDNYWYTSFHWDYRGRHIEGRVEDIYYEHFGKVLYIVVRNSNGKQYRMLKITKEGVKMLWARKN